MRLPAQVEKLASRFDAMSMRERALVLGASFAALVMIWTLAILDPLAAKRRALDAEMISLNEQIEAAKSGVAAANASDPTTLALAKEKQLKAKLDLINMHLANQSAGLIAPERMVQVIQDVLRSQRGVRLVSLHNKPVETLAKSPAAAKPKVDDGETDMAEATVPDQPSSGPFVHPVELIVEGSYLDVLAYLQALERLEWRFYWKVLDLETTRYPVNRVRIELSTLSMDKDWIGV